MPRPFRRILVLAVVVLAGCQPEPSDPSMISPPAPSAEPASAFDVTRCGSVTGRIVWTGDVPSVPSLDAASPGAVVPNPHAPRIDPGSRGLAGAVVFLRPVKPTAGRAWNHPPVRVEMSPERIQVVQGDGPSRAVGFVKRGDEVSIRSTVTGPLMLRARGAAFFTLSLSEADRPLTRRFDQPGVAELSSGSGQFWAAADLFVCDHPYYAVTGTDGSFRLADVSEGDHELVTWVRDWRIAGKDRDPETGLVVRLRYAQPVEKPSRIHVRPGQMALTEIPLGFTDFRD